MQSNHRYETNLTYRPTLNHSYKINYTRQKEPDVQNQLKSKTNQVVQDQQNLPKIQNHYLNLLIIFIRPVSKLIRYNQPTITIWPCQPNHTNSQRQANYLQPTNCIRNAKKQLWNSFTIFLSVSLEQIISKLIIITIINRRRGFNYFCRN